MRLQLEVRVSRPPHCLHVIVSSRDPKLRARCDRENVFVFSSRLPGEAEQAHALPGQHRDAVTLGDPPQGARQDISRRVAGQCGEG